MLVSLTVGKVDAGVAVLLTTDKRLIEFPSILLPPDIHSGSIVDINVSRNTPAEERADAAFSQLQQSILHTFGSSSPSPPVLRCRNATQTSVVLEWDEIFLATAELRSLSLYRNGAKAGNIPVGKQSTKISGLALDTEYTFHLVLRTSAGQYASERLTVKTHKMTDLHGITVTPGVMPGQLKDSLAETVSRIGAKMIEGKAVEMNVPVVVPDWVLGCEREGKIIGVRAYYLDADPSKRSIGPSQQQQQQDVSNANRQSGQGQSGGQRQVPMRDSPRIEHTPPTPEQPRPDRSFPPQQQQQQQSQQSEAPPPAPPKFTKEEEALALRQGDSGTTTEAPSISGTTVAESGHAKSEGLEKHEPDVSDEEEDDKVHNGKARSEVSDEEDDDGPKYTSVQEAADAAEDEGEGDEAGEGDEEKGGKFDEVSL
ncbi:hypothetical protein LTR56_025718 [Elasticomyces elasticus]|nr:hypothetical protein LTR56_025718 [Elasticomyces elasticus]KAK3662008.1 hypothetical protein LTR22_007179 [Elasticomyces elasticus]KAK5755917.1 hypothetical protein LTS12_014034 [Elasticomyces elasticus]